MTKHFCDACKHEMPENTTLEKRGTASVKGVTSEVRISVWGSPGHLCENCLWDMVDQVDPREKA